MQKLLIGCLVIIVLCVIGLALLGFWGYRAAGPALQQAREYVTGLGRLSELSDLEKQIANRSTFTPPASGELTEAQVENFVQVQTRMRQGLGARMQEIEAKYKGLSERRDSPPAPSEVFAALGDIAGLFVDARRYQVEALNAEGLSQAEYDWVRARVYAAGGMQVASGFNLRQLEEMARDGAAQVGIDPPAIPTPDVPARNRELVAPHVSQMTDWLPLAFFGF